MACEACGRAVGTTFDEQRGQRLCLECFAGDGAIASNSKCGNVRTRFVYQTFGDVVYDSKAEARRAEQLDLYVQGGLFKGARRQVHANLTTEFRPRIDFLVVENEEKAWYEDVKGHRTDRWVAIEKMWPDLGRLPLHILTYKYPGWETRIIEPRKMDVSAIAESQVL
jgi:hypothetical protein